MSDSDSVIDLFDIHETPKSVERPKLLQLAKNEEKKLKEKTKKSSNDKKFEKKKRIVEEIPKPSKPSVSDKRIKDLKRKDENLISPKKLSEIGEKRRKYISNKNNMKSLHSQTTILSDNTLPNNDDVVVVDDDDDDDVDDSIINEIVGKNSGIRKRKSTDVIINSGNLEENLTDKIIDDEFNYIDKNDGKKSICKSGNSEDMLVAASSIRRKNSNKRKNRRVSHFVIDPSNVIGIIEYAKKNSILTPVDNRDENDEMKLFQNASLTQFPSWHEWSKQQIAAKKKAQNVLYSDSSSIKNDLKDSYTTSTNDTKQTNYMYPTSQKVHFNDVLQSYIWQPPFTKEIRLIGFLFQLISFSFLIISLFHCQWLKVIYYSKPPVITHIQLDIGLVMVRLPTSASLLLMDETWNSQELEKNLTQTVRSTINFLEDARFMIFFKADWHDAIVCLNLLTISLVILGIILIIVSFVCRKNNQRSLPNDKSYYFHSASEAMLAAFILGISVMIAFTLMPNNYLINLSDQLKKIDNDLASTCTYLRNGTIENYLDLKVTWKLGYIYSWTAHGCLLISALLLGYDDFVLRCITFKYRCKCQSKSKDYNMDNNSTSYRA
ncbi:hypothetical protein SNEBB_001579 [Seison nebaliae]|nr:hypothetical protein SNEBB_001579 [Seison nebaliae]